MRKSINNWHNVYFIMLMFLALIPASASQVIGVPPQFAALCTPAQSPALATWQGFHNIDVNNNINGSSVTYISTTMIYSTMPGDKRYAWMDDLMKNVL
jgi:hypothetical protein